MKSVDVIRQIDTIINSELRFFISVCFAVESVHRTINNYFNLQCIKNKNRNSDLMMVSICLTSALSISLVHTKRKECRFYVNGQAITYFFDINQIKYPFETKQNFRVKFVTK